MFRPFRHAGDLQSHSRSDLAQQLLPILSLNVKAILLYFDAYKARMQQHQEGND